ncbi:MAG: hypothetical protein IT555_14945 [Acetobacteraceae bacterium]|nr:hypothetical protein [Acetobacteraceae bacterium]
MWRRWRKGSAFFFEKKNQKTSIHPGPGADMPMSAMDKSLFASFSSEKEGLAFL